VRLRLFLSFFLIVLLTVAMVVVIARQSAAQEVRAFMLHGGMAGLDDLRRALEEYYRANGSWVGVENVLSVPGGGMGRGHGMGPGGMMGMNQRLRLAGADGVLILDTSVAAPSSGGALPGEPESALSEAELREAVRLRDGRETIGYLLAEGGADFSSSDEQFLIGRLNRAALTAGLLAGGLALVLALIFSAYLLRPVRALTLAAERLGQGDLAHRVPTQGEDELAHLGQAFNRMADSLQSANESRRAMTADIAHELRNPLAVQRAGLEALLDGIYPLTPENLAPVLDQNVLLTRLVDDLRTLALVDAGQLALERRPLDFPSLAGRVVERFEPQADAQNIRLDFDFSADGPVAFPQLSLDPQRMEQVLSNLLSNALRYTLDGGQILITLEHSGGSVMLSVRDSGPGIPEEALPHIFKRFYRADRARSRQEGGTGLGLAIARQLVLAHGGTLTARNHPGGGAEFILNLPVQ
jgi:signal transduction histidine kinase